MKAKQWKWLVAITLAATCLTMLVLRPQEDEIAFLRHFPHRNEVADAYGDGSKTVVRFQAPPLEVAKAIGIPEDSVRWLIRDREREYNRRGKVAVPVMMGRGLGEYEIWFNVPVPPASVRAIPLGAERLRVNFEIA